MSADLCSYCCASRYASMYEIIKFRCLQMLAFMPVSAGMQVCFEIVRNRCLQILLRWVLVAHQHRSNSPQISDSAIEVLQGSSRSKQALTGLIKERVLYCIHHHRSLDVAASMREEVALLTSLVTGSPTADAQAWQSQMMLIFQLLLPATGLSFTAIRLCGTVLC